ncbi:hypothetical protein B0H34DRAFT_860496 [Crassisporium funariophilum]|nr:hypothetical protein B0H34DRAFT_860496 [Crassisporium funariophilum]
MDIDPIPVETASPPAQSVSPIHKATSPKFIPPPTTRGRVRKFPRKFTNFLPNLTTRLPHIPPCQRHPPQPTAKPRDVTPERPATPPTPEPLLFKTVTNDFGLYREYPSYPMKETDESEDLDNLCDSPGLVTAQTREQGQWWKVFGISRSFEGQGGLFAPFLNSTVFRLMNWFYSGGNVKSISELDQLVKEVLLADDFDRKHLKGFSATRELRRLDTADQKSPFAKENGWTTSTIKIPLPCEHVKHNSEASAPTLDIPNVHHRSIVKTIVSAFQDETANSFHLTPCRQFWKRTPTSMPERVITEVYNSDAFYGEHVKVTQLPPEPGPYLETVVAAIMLSSDSTHLANFGDAALWPIYLFFGNLSKYFRLKPSNFATHHIAYIPSDLYMKAFNGVAASAATITHLKRKLMHAIWLLLLDPEFMYAYEHGIVIFGFNFFSMFVPDLLHEFELGVWKAVFTHLMRIFYAAGDNCIQALNWRYWRVLTFGRNTIRRFSNNVSAMKKLAARDFEDLLQCSMPVFEGLLAPKHDKVVQDLLFTLCTWHGLAKLRLHTSLTLAGLKLTTKSLGQALRSFVKTVCMQYKTCALPCEEAAQTRRRANAAAKGKPAPKSKARGKQPDVNILPKLLNLFTYKLHALGDYIAAILRFGPSDGFSTQTGELEHKKVKRFYARTNKGQTFERQISRHQHRQRILCRIASHVKNGQNVNKANTTPPPPPPAPSTHSVPPVPLPTTCPRAPVVPVDESDALPPTQPEQHHHISNSKRHVTNLFRWLDENNADPALKAYLKDHLLSRLSGDTSDGQEHCYLDDERDNVGIVNDRLYRHKVLHVNYTTYDVRRSQDSINPRIHSDVMTLSREDDPNVHPYLYAHVLGIFHVDIKHHGPHSTTANTQRMEFLWVRWFQRDRSYAAGWNTRRLHRLSFLKSDAPDGAFGFVDPSDIIQGTHLIPAFAHGTSSHYLGSSIAREFADKELGDEDWKFFYVNMFVDCDMVMRFLGRGVGHKATNEFTECLQPNFMSHCNVEEDNEGEDNDMMDEGDNIDAAVNSEEEEDKEDQDKEEDQDEDKDEENEDKDEYFEGKDGEEPWDMDNIEAEGYGEF